MLVNRPVFSDHVLLLIQRWDLLLFLCLGVGFECEDVFSNIALLDKLFKILTEEPTLRSSVPMTVMEGTIISRSWTSNVVYFLPPDALLRVVPWWLRRRPELGALTRWSCWIFNRPGVGSAESARTVASWKRPVCDPGRQRRGLRAVASVLYRRRRGWKTGWRSYCFLQLDV